MRNMRILDCSDLTWLRNLVGARNSIAFTAVLLFAVSANAFPAKLLVSAQHQQVSQHYSRAISDYTRVLKAQPTLVAAWIGRGQSYLALGRTHDAMGDFARWQKLEPRNPYAAIWLYLATSRNGGHKGKQLPGLPSGASTYWPQPVVRYLSGEIDWETMFDKAEAATGPARDREICEAAFFYAENVLAQGKMKSALGGFTIARHERCKSQAALQALAMSEYQKLYRAGYRARPSE